MRARSALLVWTAAISIAALAWVTTLCIALWTDLEPAQRELLAALLRPRVALVVLLLILLPVPIGLLLRFWVRAYPKAAAHMRDEVLIIANANSEHRVTPVGDANLGLQLLLQMSGPTSIYGPVLGQARDPQTGVVVTISPPVDPYYPTSGDAMLSGLLASRNFAAGGINGSVQFALSGSARWCNPNNWILKPR